MRKIRKAVFPVAGFGTRFLPVTKSMPKELLPISEKPLIQYAVEEAVEAGIDTMIFVTGRNKRAIEDHFDSNPELEEALRKKGMYEQVDMVKNILPKGIECIFVRQHEQLGLGHAVLCAERVVGTDPFAVLLADDFLILDGNSVLSDLISSYERTGKTQLSVTQIFGNEISQYGVIQPGTLINAVASIVEKPALENAPSNLASLGRYVLTADIFEILRYQKPGLGGEIQLTDAINAQAARNDVEFVNLKGRRFDCGSVRGYLDAILYIAETKGYL